MAERSVNKEWDLLLITDATASMQAYLTALNDSLPQIFRISALTGAFKRIGVLAYRDYCGGELTEWSGWFGKDETVTRDEIMKFTQSLEPEYGGDWPEATKTAFAKAYSVMRSDAKTLILLYTDASPHLPLDFHMNRIDEQTFLTKDGYDNDSPRFADWVSAVRKFRNGEKKAQVFTIGNGYAVPLAPYAFLSHKTDGALYLLDHMRAPLISSLTMSILLTWMGVEKAGTEDQMKTTTAVRYRDTAQMAGIRFETDKDVDMYFQVLSHHRREKVAENLYERRIRDVNALRRTMAVRVPPVQDFGQRYLSDENYKKDVVDHLSKIIDEDVSSITVNPVFGSLWRVVANDRESDSREGLVQKFSISVERLPQGEEKDAMKKWLEESYDFKTEITEKLDDIPVEEKYPCVFLDPTLDWSAEEWATAKGERLFSRDDLLEIGRSCDNRVLKRLGRVLILLTYVESEKDLPAHIKVMPLDQVPRLPLALANKGHGRAFFQLLLHAIFPGTRLARRPAALLAALSIKMGIKHLLPIAVPEMLGWKKRWNDLETPENWNTSCLSLLLDADRSFTQCLASGEQVGSYPANITLLNSEDRSLFKRLVEYSVLLANMSTTLQARVGWRPDKSKVPIGPLVVCRFCKYPRSVTIMAPNDTCGICASTPDLFTMKSKEECLLARVTANDTEKTEATWVECSSLTCRAQYVVYNHDCLNVRVKCFYCRAEGQAKMKDKKNKAVKAKTAHPQIKPPAPWVECTKCLSRIIWPQSYRPKDPSFIRDYHCPACEGGQETVVNKDTTPKSLVQENGDDWLLQYDNFPQAFGDASLFKKLKAVGIETFSLIEILPQLPRFAPSLTYRGKLIRNIDDIRTALWGWINTRSAETGTCSLCFESVNKRIWRSACGRKGCNQPICDGCRKEWFGLNEAGRIINVAALSCPFCRRLPAIKAAGVYITSLRNLRSVIENAGTWIYAWCKDCATAKQLVERVCARGPPLEINGWTCDDCKHAQAEAASGKALQRFRPCPGCDTVTEKISGCGHITCPVCAAHWCYFCGGEFHYSEIYDHMYKEHGSIFGGDYDEWDVDENEED
ncbi:hypothetical protein F5Y16DRAFT_373947 [Xylariaceae sp. FL0255]|nr:hypothetical protein F5Y16DRAFT_373947 [Xylariaceae sp. FL0255]